MGSGKDNNAKTFSSDKKNDEEDKERSNQTKGKNKRRTSVKSNDEDNGGEFSYYFKKSIEMKEVYPDLSDYAAADIDRDEYIFPNSDTKLIDTDILDNAPLWQLRRGLNEIYAKRGRKFINDGQRIYFESKSWYDGIIEAGDFEEDFLNEYEKNNVALLQERILRLSEGINLGELELRVYSFLKEEKANGVLGSRFDPDTLDNILIKDIICREYDESIDYEKLRNEAGKISYYDADDDIAAIKSEDLDLLLQKLFGIGLNEINWNESGVYYSKREDVYYTLHKDCKEVLIESVELVDMENGRYRFICREEGYKEDNRFIIVELESKNEDFKFISVK